MILIKRGFTLVELMVTIAVLTVVMLLAIPDFTSMIRNNSIASMNNNLLAALNFARSEAVKRAVPVSVCATQDANFTACGSNWSLGWMIFVNPTGGTTLSNTSTAPLLKVEKITDQSATITTSPNVGIATYTSTGFPTSNTGNVSFTIKSTGCTGDAGRLVTISVTGRPSAVNVSCP
ncbi:MAG: GspH/FimT family pseudopilin [Candidatus Berkiella sp.]